jgi:rSAM/selenodomain-associated transferase 2
VISVVIPTLDEARTIVPLLDALQVALDPADEVIVVDGGSADGTADLARGSGARVIEAPRGRARQMNAGAAVARGEWLLFLPADAGVDRPMIDAIRASTSAWGYFAVRLDARGLAFRAIEAGINLRSRLFDTPSGDQAIFVHREVFAAVGGYPDVPLMEDLLLADALRARARPSRPALTVRTSARRWQTHGVVRTVLRMWSLRIAFRLGVSPARLAPRYAHAR